LSLLLLISLFAFAAPARAVPAKIGDVYQIATSGDLTWFRDSINSETIPASSDAKLTADIDLGGGNWIPIANGSVWYAGTFDGGGYRVNYGISGGQNIAGLFDRIGRGGVVRDLTVSCDINVTGNVTGGGDAYAGGVAGSNSGTISNCTSLGRVSANFSGANAEAVGGVAGHNNGTISNCANSGSVSSTGGARCYAGGVAGSNSGTISNCANSGVSGGEFAGGVVGYNYKGTISNCANSGGVSGGRYAGGVGGFNFIGTILNCANSGGVSGGNYAGGVAGRNEGSTILNCANIGGVVSSGSNYYAGGVAGMNTNGSSITNSANSGSVSGGYARGGVVGRNEGAITNCGWLNSTANKDVGWNTSGGSSSDVVSLASTDNIVTTVLISSCDLTINGTGTPSPVFVCYPDSSTLAVSGGGLTVSSYDCAVAALSGDSLTGIATGKAPLTVSAVITAKKFGNADVSPLSADLSCAVTVNGIAVDSVTVSCDKTELEIGRTADLTAIVSPDNATFPTVTWSVSGDAVTLSATSGDSVTATAASSGTATITATADRKSATHVIAVGVPFVSVESVTLSESSLTLETGGTHSLTATVLPADATNKAVSWSSSNSAIAAVDAEGRVTAAAAGTATITVTTADGGKTASCAVTVNGTPTPTPTPSGGSSGGCAAGIGATALLTLLPLALRRRKK
ncbi:MAG: Ig-like domain-containing protein, partial [Synergistaceae bacterium]|nr:Ig-like domain-containing protein [Synergistaceae bacterium]